MKLLVTRSVLGNRFTCSNKKLLVTKTPRVWLRDAPVMTLVLAQRAEDLPRVMFALQEHFLTLNFPFSLSTNGI